MCHCNYFGLVRQLCDKRIPPLVEESATPPTPLAEAIMNMVTRPLKLIATIREEETKETR